MEKSLLLYIIILSGFIVGCGSNGEDPGQKKINCYTEKLKNIQSKPIYTEIMTKFVDTFQVMKNDKRYFGVPQKVTNKIDEAIFFNKNKTECLLIVLQKSDQSLVFGNARIIRGLLQGDEWVFKPGLHYSYDKSYFDQYPENSFENISKLARYNVLSDGEVKADGCEIDEIYWFEKLKR